MLQLGAKRFGHENDRSSAEVENDRRYTPSWLAEGQAYFHCILILIIVIIVITTVTTTTIFITVVGHLRLTVR